MKAIGGQEVEVLPESVSLADKLRAGVCIGVALGELGVIASEAIGSVSPDSLGGKGILAASVVLVLQGIPSLGRIDEYQQQRRAGL